MKKCSFVWAMVLAAVLCMTVGTCIAEGAWTLPSGLQVIEAEAFYGVPGSERIIVPEGVTEIGSKAFANSKSQEIDLPASLTSIAGDAFDACEALTLVVEMNSYAHTFAKEKEIPYRLKVTPAEDFIYGGFWGNNCAITGYIGFDKVVIVPEKSPDGYTVTSVGEGAFSYRRMTRVVLPDSVETIDRDAFRFCENLLSIKLGKNLRRINSGAFLRCYSLTSITMPEKLYTIGGGAFNGCDSLVSVHMPEGLTTIEGGAFYGCDSLVSVHLPDSVEKLGEGIFEYCDNLSNVNYPKNWKETESPCASPFYRCKSLTSMIVPEGVTKIPEYAFYGVKNLTFILPSTLKYIDRCAFNNCTNIVFCGTKGTYAESYATKHGIPFIVSEEHPTAITGTFAQSSYSVEIGGAALQLTGNVTSSSAIERITINVKEIDDAAYQRLMTCTFDGNQTSIIAPPIKS